MEFEIFSIWLYILSIHAQQYEVNLILIFNSRKQINDKLLSLKYFNHSVDYITIINSYFQCQHWGLGGILMKFQILDLLHRK